MTLDESWYTEQGDGYALSLRIVEKLHDEQSPYQRIEVFETETFGRLLTLDGLTMLTSRDNFIYHEMMVHPALLLHPEPINVAIIGGGDCGTLTEVLKHPEPRQVWQVELDERVTRVSEQFFPELCASNGDPRAGFVFADGIEWMAGRDAGSLDVIILDTTDPVGQAARLFGEPFYRDCHRALAPGGILVAQSESPLFNADLLKQMRAAMHRASYIDVQSLLFPLCTYPSGWWSATMACKGDQFGRLRAASLGCRYFSPDIYRSALVLPPFVMKGMKGTDLFN